jgi:hypothetical protein
MGIVREKSACGSPGRIGNARILSPKCFTERFSKRTASPAVPAADDVTEFSRPARGCPFQRRCHRKVGTICGTTPPPQQVTLERHSIRCHHSLAAVLEQQEAMK